MKKFETKVARSEKEDSLANYDDEWNGQMLI